MHVERVVAHAFGPLERETLDLAPGCNVVHGTNESGKSTWHAAITTALAGRRRGRGGARTAEREFAERHRPWSGERWAVDARVRTADGRVLTVHQDLEEPALSQATDEAGRSVLDEVLADGMPDATRLLGLDRDAFAASASVRQADVARVEHGVDALKDYLQRAASTRKAESTAGAALDRLNAFRSEAVGADRKNAVKPLRRALEEVAARRSALEDATQRHAELIATTEQCARLRADAAGATLERRAAEAVRAELEAQRLDAVTAHVADLTDRCPAAPPPLARDDEQAAAVAGALRCWDDRPTVPPPPSPGPGELRARLDEPPATVGDTHVHPTVVEAVRAAQRAHDALDFHRDHEPLAPSLPPGTEPVELRELARRLREEPPPEATAAPVPSRLVPVLVAVLAALAGGAAVLAGALVAGAVVAAAGAVLAAVLAWRHPAPPVAAEPDSPIRARLAQLGLRPDPGTLDALVDRADEHRSWAEDGDRLRSEAGRADARAAEVVAARLPAAPSGAPTLQDLIDAYEDACERAAHAQRAAADERAALETTLALALESERQRGQALAGCAEAARAVREAAAAVGVLVAGDEALVDGLRGWQRDRRRRMAEADAARAMWDELQQVGGGRPLSAWAEQRDRARAEADALAEGIDTEVLAHERDAGPGVAARTDAERVAIDRAHQEAARLEARQADQPSVAEATEAAAAAEVELERVTGLDHVLGTTMECLAQAQDRLYRSLAPVLAERLSDALPAVTTGRYEEVTVDPETLQVRVRLADGTLQPAAHLSHGTAEQMYLLLRVAMAERLVVGDESCPLLLDEVTVHCDPERTQAILSLLAEVAETRQVVLFTQEAEVVAWAEQHLVGDRHRVIALDRPAVPA